MSKYLKIAIRAIIRRAIIQENIDAITDYSQNDTQHSRRYQMPNLIIDEMALDGVINTRELNGEYNDVLFIS